MHLSTDSADRSCSSADIRIRTECGGLLADGNKQGRRDLIGEQARIDFMCRSAPRLIKGIHTPLHLSLLKTIEPVISLAFHQALSQVNRAFQSSFPFAHIV
jgi:hypothetical protein